MINTSPFFRNSSLAIARAALPLHSIAKTHIAPRRVWRSPSSLLPGASGTRARLHARAGHTSFRTESCPFPRSQLRRPQWPPESSALQMCSLDPSSDAHTSRQRAVLSWHCMSRCGNHCGAVWTLYGGNGGFFCVFCNIQLLSTVGSVKIRIDAKEGGGV